MKEITATNRVFYESYHAIKDIDVPGSKFNYALAGIIDTLKNHIDILAKSYKMPKGLDAFNIERDKILKKGVTEEMEVELETLAEKYKGVLAENKAQIDDQQKLLDETETLSFRRFIKEGQIPDGVTTKQMNGIFIFIEEEEEEE